MSRAQVGATTGALQILLGAGDGTFQGLDPVPISLVPESLVAGDFNGDGRLDLAIVEYDSASGQSLIAVLLGKGDGTFTPAPAVPLPLAGVWS